MPECPECKSKHVVKNGHIHNGKQRFKCKNCARQFVENPAFRVITNDTKERIDKLLLEKIPLAGISRVEGVSESWLQSYVNDKYANVKQKANVAPKKGTWLSNVMNSGHL